MSIGRVSSDAAPWARLPMALVGFAVLALGCSAFVVARYDPAFVDAGSISAAPALLMLNAIPLAIIALLLLGLTRRPLCSLGLALLAGYALFVANTIKSTLLDTPVLPSDFLLLGHLGDGGALLVHYLPGSGWFKPACALAVLLLLAVFERPWTRLRGMRQVLLLACTVALAASLVLGTSPWSNVYAGDPGSFHSWSPAKAASEDGLTVTLLRYTWRMKFALPAPDRAAAEHVAQAHPMLPATGNASRELPDIIVLQSESFFDVANLKGLDPDQALPEYRRLAAHAQHGDMFVPTFGGGTIRTEFEILTGIAMRYFPLIEYPYFRLTARTLPSLASVLAGLGYETIAVHPHSREFWNRATAFSQMGFTRFDALEQFDGAPRVGYYISDEALVDHMLGLLDAANRPVFMFAISMENHGPYDHYPNADQQRIAHEQVPAGLPVADAAQLRGYLYHLHDADRALGRLADALRQRQRRSLLLFYGDHLPSLPDLYQTLGFDDGVSAQQQPVPWLLVDSAHNEPQTKSTASAAFYMPALLLDTAGIDDRGYFHLLEDLRLEDSPQPGWTPVNEDGLRAIMLLRQRGEFDELKGSSANVDGHSGF